MASSPPYPGFQGDCREWANLLPVGIRFNPTDEELVGYYLAAKKHGGTAHGLSNNGLIKDLNVYDCEPSQLPGLPYNLGDGKMYFFTSLQKKYQNGPKFNRDTPGGSWKITQRPSVVSGKDGKPIGTKTPLAYYKGKSNPKKTQWLMQQYLLESQPSNQNDDISDWALCVVYHFKPERENKKGNGIDQSSMLNIMLGSSPNFATASRSVSASPLSTPLPNPLQNSISFQIMSSNEKLGEALCFDPQFFCSSNPVSVEGEHVVNTPFSPNPFPATPDSTMDIHPNHYPSTQNNFQYLEPNICGYSNFNTGQDFLYGHPTGDSCNINTLGTSSDAHTYPSENPNLDPQYY